MSRRKSDTEQMAAILNILVEMVVFNVKRIVEFPREFCVHWEYDELGRPNIIIDAAPEDRPRIVGIGGQNINAITTLAKAAAATEATQRDCYVPYFRIIVRRSPIVER